MKTFKAMAVASSMEPGAISIRDRNGRASTFKRGLKEAGFEDGERVVVVDEESFEKLQRAASRAAQIDP